jgi:copper(I)-binding protein
VNHDKGAGLPAATDQRATAPGPRVTASLPGLARSALIPLAAAAVALAGLTVYTASGAAGLPPARVTVSRARVFVPSTSEVTAAFFSLRNTGGTAARLVSVRSPWGTAMLTRSVVVRGGGRMQRLRDLAVPVGRTVTMTPEGTDVMVPHPPHLTPGQRLAFRLGFGDGTTLRVTAVVVRPGD